MQILFLAHRLPYPPDKGERIRAFHELRYLGMRHEVDLFCFADSPECAHNQKHLREYCRSIHVEVLTQPMRLLRAGVNYVTGKPMSFGFFGSHSFGRAVRQAMNRTNYDAVFVYSSSMGQFLPEHLATPLAVDFVDADSQKFKQYASRTDPVRALIYGREGRLVACAEQRLGRLAALSFAVTQHDANDLGGTSSKDFKVEVIQNGVQVPKFCEEDGPGLPGLQPFVLFVGTMSYPPNSDAAAYFAKSLLPLVRKKYPEMKFVVVGRDPDRQVRALASIPGVLVTGFVPDPFLYFRNAECSVAPFRISQGFHNKIAESLAVGTPVITSSRAKDGIGLCESEGLFVADTSEEFVHKLALAMEPMFRRKLRQEAPALRRALSWDARLAKMEQMIVQVSTKTSTSCAVAVEQ
jgi:polysaccharide biosynthesis protein PslH